MLCYFSNNLKIGYFFGDKFFSVLGTQVPQFGHLWFLAQACCRGAPPAQIAVYSSALRCLVAEILALIAAGLGHLFAFSSVCSPPGHPSYTPLPIMPEVTPPPFRFHLPWTP